MIGAGKAAASMAQAFEVSYSPSLEGLVVTRYGHAAPTRRIEVVEAAHPLPDEGGLRAAERILGMVRGLTGRDLVVALMSGGGSSLLTLPAPGITLEEKAAVAGELLHCGASIGEINAVRKALSAIKGGRLLAAAGDARVVTYVLSDVPGDDPSIVASGPTVSDNTPPGEALRIVDRYGLAVSSSVRCLLSTPLPHLAHRRGEAGGGNETHIVASAATALQAAAEEARRLGVEPRVLSDRIEGEAREVAREHAALAVHLAFEGKALVLLSGGETTVAVRGQGRGGRNVEYLAALAQALGGHPGIHALAADTDGIDGTVPNAGAFIDPTTPARAGARLAHTLEENDAHTLFESLGDTLVTGPTLTNVNDFRAILILPT